MRENEAALTTIIIDEFLLSGTKAAVKEEEDRKGACADGACGAIALILS